MLEIPFCLASLDICWTISLKLAFAKLEIGNNKIKIMNSKNLKRFKNKYLRNSKSYVQDFNKLIKN